MRGVLWWSASCEVGNRECSIPMASSAGCGLCGHVSAPALCACAQPATCTDGLKNGYETDVDCGGKECHNCLIGQACLASTDCESEHCSGGKCVAQVRVLLAGCVPKLVCCTACAGCWAVCAQLSAAQREKSTRHTTSTVQLALPCTAVLPACSFPTCHPHGCCIALLPPLPRRPPPAPPGGSPVASTALATVLARAVS